VVNYIHKKLHLHAHRCIRQSTLKKKRHYTPISGRLAKPPIDN